MNNLHKQLAIELFDAQNKRKTISPLISRFPDLTIDDAYKVSLETIQLKTQAKESVIGKKIGVTSEAVQKMLNVHQPDFGFLTDTMHYPDGSNISLQKSLLIQPRAEGEIAFCLKHDIKGPNVTAEQVLEATEWVAPCFEIVDSRIENWNISIVDTVADNASCGVFVIGLDRKDPKTIDLASAKMTMFQNGKHAASGVGSAVQGHPAQAVAWLANTLGNYGIEFKAGEIILSGALAPLIDAKSGDTFEMTIEGLGSCSVSFCD
ncbi:fumarylacetoacetate hydrolase family protein [Aliiglaciecola lipolytica]|uniref:2-keto-4-pentenoate hydratase n=1 Tax=Aliiglaciecola lipolytica E3 TaxID=1127673 RepID=K6YRP9_9ALTE|nr:fumarylacetoacetate hydrolase family protein [Aliiglaciecola lipolytica]GAC13995.1 2-keto-4-pentenoate hydratase [Aliiglaciecola lipolytica E3]